MALSVPALISKALSAASSWGLTLFPYSLTGWLRCAVSVPLQIAVVWLHLCTVKTTPSLLNGWFFSVCLRAVYDALRGTCPHSTNGRTALTGYLRQLLHQPCWPSSSRSSARTPVHAAFCGWPYPSIKAICAVLLPYCRCSQQLCTPHQPL